VRPDREWALLDMPGQHRDPLDEIAELARKADEINHNRDRGDDHCHVFHGDIRSAELSGVAIDGPNSFIFVLLVRCAGAGASELNDALPAAGPERRSPGAGTPGPEPDRDQSDGPYAANYVIYL
jgi:hypothetical protein